MAVKMKHPIAMDRGNSKVKKSLTDRHPPHFALKIDSFSLLYKVGVHDLAQSYDTEVFEAVGYKWKLCLYPNGDKGNNGEGYISLYLVIVDTYDLPRGWKVRANLKFFLYDHLQNKYLTIQGANSTASKFDAKKTGFGFARFLPVSSFVHAGNGYLVKDTCIFGAEILVENYICTDFTLESLGMVKAPYIWKIDKFPYLSDALIFSDVFTVGNRKWKLRLYPRGDRPGKSDTLSLFLEAEDLKKYPQRKEFVKFEFCIVNQCGGKDMRIRCKGCCFTKYIYYRGLSVFLPLADLHDASKGFLLNDTLIIKATINVFSTARSFLTTTGTIDLPPAKIQIPEQLQETKVQNQGLKNLTVMNFSGLTAPTAAAETTKLPQAKGSLKREVALNLPRYPTPKAMV